MDVKLLIDDIVRQTTVLIAQLSTAAGVRAPLSHVADQVFVELARELEAQGVGRKVVADMFGLALRSYQLKYQRLTESVVPGASLWQSVYGALGDGPRTKLELHAKLKTAEPADVAAVLRDLVGSGLAYSSGRGQGALFGLTSEADRRRFSEASAGQALAHMVWQMVATGRAEARADLLSQLNVSAEALDAAVALLVEDGRVTDQDGKLFAESLHIPVGSELGWEAAVSDHFRAVATAVAAKLQHGRSQVADRIGGGTLRFTIYPGHPYETQVYGLLQQTRTTAGALWQEVAAYNRETPPPDGAPIVTFYFGQAVTGADTLPADDDTNEVA